MSSTQTVLCGTCKCAVKTVANPQAHDQVSCPRCGRSDRFDKVMASVKEFVAHLAHKNIAEQFTASTRGNRFIKFTAQKPQHRSFRWICTEVRF